MLKSILWLIFFIAVCLIAGIIGSLSMKTSLHTWYQSLVKPSINPPGWLFGPVWNFLYITMGVSLFFIFREKPNTYFPYIVFAIGLLLNILWPYIFFYFQNLLLSVIEIIVLWIAIGINVYVFFQYSYIAGILLIPYFLWVSFAVILNFLILKLNT
jgi:translocator protein